MLKKYIFIILISYSFTTYSQINFIIRPSIETVGGFSNNCMGANYIFWKPYTNNPFFSFSKTKIFYPNHISHILPGVDIETKINNKTYFSIGIHKDINKSGFNLDYLTQNSNNSTIISNTFQEVRGINTVKFPLNVIFKDIFKNNIIDSSKHTFRIGIDYFFGTDLVLANRVKPNENHYFSENNNSLLWNGDTISVDFYINNSFNKKNQIRKINYKLSTGFRFRFIQKQKEILSVSLYFEKGLRNLSVQSMKFSINKTPLLYYVASNGSGIYLQISKPFNYAIKKKK